MTREIKPHDAFREIDENLKKAYEELMSEELPDRFKVLIQQLRTDTRGKDDTPKDEEGAN